MRKFLLIGLALLGLSTTAQILNPGFESATGNQPDDYNTGFYSTYFIQDTTDAHSGTQAAFIKGFGAQSYSVQGAVLGVFSISGRPAALTGWYKCNLQPGDSLVFNPYVYATNVYSPSRAAYAFTTTSTAVYKQFTASFNYAGFTSTSVATIFVSIYLSGPNVDATNTFVPQSGTWAMIDDLELVQPVATGVEQNAPVMTSIEKVYPQPASNVAWLVYRLPEDATCDLQLLDVTGKTVLQVLNDQKQTAGRYKAEIDVSALPSGIYFARLRTGSGVQVAKIIRQ